MDGEAVGEHMASLRDRLGWDRRGEGVSVLADGAPWPWTQAGKHLPDHEGCLDLWHLMEHLHAAGRAVHGEGGGEGDEARRWAEKQRALLFRHGSIRYLKRHLVQEVKVARRVDPEGEAATALRSLLGYLWKHRGRPGYRDRLRRGLPTPGGRQRSDRGRVQEHAAPPPEEE